MAGFLEAPAEIDVVAGRAKLGVEPTEFLQHVFPDREVAAGNVLGLGVGDEHVDRPAGRVGDALGNRVRVRGRDVRSANRCAARPIEGVREVMHPVRIGPGVGVEIGDDLAGSGGSADVSSGTQARIRSPDEPHVELRRDRSGVVRRPVVDDDDLEVRVLEALDPLQRRPQRSAAVEGADHQRHSRPVPFSGNGTSAKAEVTAASAGFGSRSGRVRPKAQSSTYSPARNHSSVHENTNAPAQPDANVWRICQSSAFACTSSPLRSASRPTSLIRRGRSPARLWSRAR